MTEHILDRPVWTTLSSVHAQFAVGGARARRFQVEISPLAGAADESPESVAELAVLVPATGGIIVVQVAAIPCPAGLVLSQASELTQMIFGGEPAAPSGRHRIERLGEADAPEMLALATLTRPGPFAARTHQLGEFWGVKQDGRLIAMAGERMKQPGYTEISGVCTHPDLQGRGLGGDLLLTQMNRVRGRGDVAYLHAYASNAGAIRLYEKLGFRQRARLNVARLDRI